MSKMNEDVYKNKRALPNKILNEDGSVTDLLGNSVIPTDETYKKIPALPNKVLNSDGTYSTLSEIIGGSAGKDLFIIVNELPEEGEPNKIYLVPDGKGGFDEYHYVDGKWDPIGAIDMGVSPQVYYWDSTSTQEEKVEFWNTVVNATKDTPVIVYSHISNSDSSYSSYVYFKKNIFTNQMTQYTFSFTSHSLDVSDKVNCTQHREWRTVVQLTLNNTTVTNVGKWTYNDTIDYLRIDYDYSTPYVPQYPGSPATKKYVDDSIANAITDAMGGEY